MDHSIIHNQKENQNPLLPRQRHKGDRNLFLYGDKEKPLSDRTNRGRTDTPSKPLDLAQHLSKHSADKENIVLQYHTDPRRKVLERAYQASRPSWDSTFKPEQGQFPSIEEFEAGFPEVPKDTNPFRNWTSDGQFANRKNDTNPFVHETQPDQLEREFHQAELRKQGENLEHSFQRQLHETKKVGEDLRESLEERKRQLQELEDKIKKYRFDLSPVNDSFETHSSEIRDFETSSPKESEKPWENHKEVKKPSDARALEDKLNTFFERGRGDLFMEQPNLVKDLGGYGTDTELTEMRKGDTAVYFDGEKYNFAFNAKSVPKHFGYRVKVDDKVLQEITAQEQGPVGGRGEWYFPKKVFRIEMPGKVGEKPQILITDNEKQAHELIQKQNLNGKVFDLSGARKTANELHQDFPPHRGGEYDAPPPYSEYDQTGLNNRHSEMSMHIGRLQRGIHETESIGDIKVNDSYWSEWRNMLYSGKLDEYVTRKTKKWREKQTDSIVVREEKMKKKVKAGKMLEDDMLKEMNNYKKEYEKEEMRRILKTVEKRAKSEQGHSHEGRSAGIVKKTAKKLWALISGDRRRLTVSDNQRSGQQWLDVQGYPQDKKQKFGVSNHDKKNDWSHVEGDDALPPYPSHEGITSSGDLKKNEKLESKFPRRFDVIHDSYSKHNEDRRPLFIADYLQNKQEWSDFSGNKKTKKQEFKSGRQAMDFGMLAQAVAVY